MTRAALPQPPCVFADLAANIGPSADYEFKRFTDLTGVTVTGGATATIETVDGMSCLKVVTAPGTLTEVQFTSMPDVTAPMNGRPCWLAKMVNPADITSTLVFWSPAGYPAKWWQQTYTISGSPYLSIADWFPFVVSRGFGAAVGGFSWDTDAVSDTKFRITPAASKVVTMYFHSIRFLARMRPKFVISFDDNRDGLLTAKSGVYIRGVSGTHSGKDVLDAYNFKGTLFAVREQVLDEGFPAGVGGLTWAQLNTLKNAGWDLQAQAYRNPASVNNQGCTLLGPAGYATRAIASVDTVADTITCSAAHNMITAGTFGYPIEMTGTDLPAPLVTGTEYWARQTSATAFQVHPTETDSLNNTNKIDLTTAGIAANFGFRYWGSANDDSAILADYQALNAAFQAHCGVTPKHLGTNQGALDQYVYSAAKKAGYKTIRSTQSIHFTPAFMQTALFNLALPLSLGTCIYCEDTATYPTQNSVNTFIDAWIAEGGIGYSYLHQFPNGSQQFDWVCQRVEYWQKLGCCDVGTMSEFWDSLQ